MTLRSATKTLLVLSLALPVVQCVLVWVGGLLTSMGDAGRGGGRWPRRHRLPGRLVVSLVGCAGDGDVGRYCEEPNG